MAVILRYFSEFAYLPGVLRKSSRSLSHLLMSSSRDMTADRHTDRHKDCNTLHHNNRICTCSDYNLAGYTGVGALHSFLPSKVSWWIKKGWGSIGHSPSLVSEFRFPFNALILLAGRQKRHHAQYSQVLSRRWIHVSPKNSRKQGQSNENWVQVCMHWVLHVYDTSTIHRVTVTSE